MRQPANKQPQRRGADNIAKFTIPADSTLLAAAAAILKDHKSNKLKSMLRHHQFAINGTPSSQFDRPVHQGDELWVNFNGSFHVFEHPKLKLIYEDNDIMVVEKGYGMLCTSPAPKSKEETVYNVLRKYVKEHNEHARIFMVHRLDRDTSGLMLVARTTKARDKFLTQWHTMLIERKYEAIVEGNIELPNGLVQSYLSDADNYEVVSSNNPEEGELAKTRYRVIERSQRFTRVELAMRHGHKNQLRVHMKDLGTPISGDRKYGGHANAIHRLALHATRLAFEHPTDGRTLTFESPIPAPMLAMIQA